MCGEVSTDKEGMSALKHNQTTKGKNSYYYAHTRDFEVPEDAKVVEGPGLITGGPPVLLESGGASKPSTPPTVPMRNYAWSEEDGTVKVSVDGADGALATEENTTVDFQPDHFVCTVTLQGKVMQLKVYLKKNIVPDQCKLRISKGKGIRLTLQKTEKGKWYDLVKPTK
jgi:hypothetical protein